MNTLKRKISTAPVKLNQGVINFSYFDNWMGASVVEGILNGRTYPKVPFVDSPKTIVDIGANIGASAVYFAEEYPESVVWAYEPSPEAFALLIGNTASLANIKITEVGLWDREVKQQLYQGGIDPVTSSVGRSSANSASSVTVQVRVASAQLRSQGIEKIDILKVDTEGCEVGILESLAAYLPNVKVVYLEYHSEEDRRRLDDLLYETHVLYGGNVNHPHRGEFCYVAKSAFPSEQSLNEFRIEIEAETPFKN